MWGYADCFAGQCVLQWHIRNGQYASGVGIGSVCTSFYALYIIVVGMVIQAPVDVCFTTEVIYYVLMLGSSLIYLKKAKWQNKKI